MKVEEVLAKYSAPSTYEKQNGLVPKSSWKLLSDQGDVKFYTREAGNARLTLLIVFRAGLTENWCGWMINKDQARAMLEYFPALYLRLNMMNDTAQLLDTHT